MIKLKCVINFTLCVFFLVVLTYFELDIYIGLWSDFVELLSSLESPFLSSTLDYFDRIPFVTVRVRGDVKESEWGMKYARDFERKLMFSPSFSILIIIFIY